MSRSELIGYGLLPRLVRRFMKRVIAIIATFCLPILGLVAPVTATADENESTGAWFTVDTRPDDDAEDLPQEVTDFRTAVFDADLAVQAVVSEEAMEMAEPGERVEIPKMGDLTVELFDGRVLEVQIDEVALTVIDDNMVPSVEVLGTATIDEDEASNVVFVFTPDEEGFYTFAGTFDSVDSELVNLTQRVGKGDVALSSIDTSQQEPGVEIAFNADDYAHLYPDNPEDGVWEGDTDPESTEGNGVSTFSAAKYNIDLVVGYPSKPKITGQDKTVHEKQMRSYVQEQVARTNRALATSKVNVRINLVAMKGVDYQQAANMHKDLDRLTGGAGTLKELHNLRSSWGADLVHLIVFDSTDGSCGVGWQPSRVAYAKMGFAVSAKANGCRDKFTFTHEIGHNLGAGHNWEDSDKKNIPFNYSYGHRVSGIARTMMAYNYKPAIQHAPRKLQFSNPDVRFLGEIGLASGTATANNAKSILNMAPVIQNYRASKVVRISGKNRLETAVEISKSVFRDVSKVDTVVVATSTGFADALSAAPWAAKMNGPLLLSGASSLDGNVANEIFRLRPAKIYVIGSSTVISDTVVNKLKTLTKSGGSVERVYGANRYETSLKIAKKGFPSVGSAFVASGANFPDALSADAAAGKLKAPLVLVQGSQNQASDELRSYLSSAGVKKIYISGGSLAVSTGLENSIKTGRTMKRYAGSDRYHTSALIGKDHHTKRGTVYVAWGGDFPDALSGAAAAGTQSAPVLLSKKACLPLSVKGVIDSISPSKKVLLGGTAVLDEGVLSIPCSS